MLKSKYLGDGEYEQGFRNSISIMLTCQSAVTYKIWGNKIAICNACGTQGIDCTETLESLDMTHFKDTIQDNGCCKIMRLSETCTDLIRKTMRGIEDVQSS